MRRSADEKLKLAAKLYAEKGGESLLAEADEIQSQNISYLTPRADKAVRELIEKERRPRRRRVVFGLAAAAVCVVFAVSLITGIPDPNGGVQSGDAPSASGMPAEILPISFTLPADYRVKTAELDQGMSVYKLESDNYGDVVLTMYYETDTSGGKPDLYSGFDEVIIEGMPVAAKVKDTYRLLAFEADDIQYTLSSEDNLGALAAFYRNITEAVYA